MRISDWSSDVCSSDLPYVTPALSMQFHYFALRKMHFLLHARALAAFPGGFGTFDELFELLTFIQTGKIDPIPVLLYGQDFWNRVDNFWALCEEVGGATCWERGSSYVEL